MPQQGNIAQYTSPIDQLHPDEVGAEALARAGRGIGAQYGQVGKDYEQAIDRVGDPIAQQIDQHDYLTEVSQGSASMSAKFNSFTTQWQQMAARDPNDKSIQGEFLNNVLEPGLQQWQDGFTTEKGQDWALSHADSVRQHFFEKTSADMMDRAGAAVKEDAATTLNQYGATVARDPTSADAAMVQFHSYIDGISKTGALPPAEIAKLRYDGTNELAKVQVQAYADKPGNGPSIALGLLNSGVHDANISPAEQEELRKYINNASHTHLEDQRLAAEQQKRVQEQQEEAAANKVLGSMKVDPNTGAVSIPNGLNSQIFTDPSLRAKAKVDLMNMIKHVSQDTDVTDPATRTANFQALGNNTLTQGDLLSQAGAGKLSKEDLSFFNERLKQTPDAVAEKGMVSNAVQQVSKSILTSAAPGLPPSPAQRQAETSFQNWFMPAYQSALNDPDLAGKSASQKAQILLSSTDPKGLLTPDKLAPFMVSPQQLLADGLKGVGPLPSQGGATAPAPVKAAALPAISDRVAGKTTYTNADGKTFLWNGTGWSNK